VKNLIKTILSKLLPTSFYLGLEAAHNRRFIQKLERKHGYRDLNLKYEQQLGRTVLTGPFEGLQYTKLTSERHITQRLLGCYESELHKAVNECLKKKYSEVLDVGCAEGYYAVGFALKAQCDCVHAFDTDPWARKACVAMAKENGVENKLSMNGFCSPDWMHAHLKPNSLIISDCEGYEFVLFAKEQISLYRDCDLIIEIHDKAPDFDHPIVQNFMGTHDVTIIASEPHDPKSFPQIDFMSEKEAAMCVDDRRQAWQGWIYLKRKGLEWSFAKHIPPGFCLVSHGASQGKRAGVRFIQRGIRRN
jgi:hypothetical protein